MAVVRVKRHCGDEPIDALLLACKRRKTEEENTSIFKFAATVSGQKENISEHISKVFSSLDKTSIKTPNISKITDKLRKEKKLFSQNNRFKVVNCLRGLNWSECSGEGDQAAAGGQSLTIVDIEATQKLPTTEGEESISNYVFDIYYSAECDLDENAMKYPISCHPIDDLVFDSYTNDIYDAEEESDDSNDENNWRNDYPDEDPDSIGEEDMKLACGIGGLKLSDADSLSSDAGEAEMLDWGDTYDAYKKRSQKFLDSESGSSSDEDAKLD